MVTAKLCYFLTLRPEVGPPTSRAEGLPTSTSVLPPGVQVGTMPMKTGQGSRMTVTVYIVEGAKPCLRGPPSSHKTLTRLIWGTFPRTLYFLPVWTTLGRKEIFQRFRFDASGPWAFFLILIFPAQERRCKHSSEDLA